MDRNTVIGFVLLAGLLFLYLFISTKSGQDIQKQQQATADSLARIQAVKQKDSIAKFQDTSAVVKTPDSNVRGFDRAVYGSEVLTTIENKVMQIVFTNRGGQPKSVTLKNYKTDGKPVVLLNTPFDQISYRVNTSPSATGETMNLYFQQGPVQATPDGRKSISFQVDGGDGKMITHQYVVDDSSYLIDFNIQLARADQLLTQGLVNLIWQNQPMRHEKDITYERQQSQLGFYEDGDFDYIFSKSQKKFEKPVMWVSVKQQFFNSTIINKNNFSGGQVEWTHQPSGDSSEIVTKATANFQLKTTPSNSTSIPLQLYYGPNSYRILKNTAPDLDKMVNLGQGFYTFVRPINKFIVMPVFDFFKKFIGSYGIVIALLTLFIRLLTSPLVYSSYLSGAKMKALRPEIEKLKQRLNNDQQQVGMEQMKLFREAGVNPLGGCIPALLQIPIFFALYSFFNSTIDLRGQPFLWADDLSSYDVIMNFGFKIPLLGGHLSLFTLTAVITSFLISIYNMNMTPDQSNPALKYMPYIFPFILLFIFNNLPSALTWYYTVSNIVTLALQFVIQNYIIDHDKILAKLEQNRKKPKTKPKWQERFEQMQEQQKKMQQQKKK
ncbi:MAG TPA: membrane protein insertase YidC [Chitinophagaceae bacterium]|nr:membrane protein insertase YidC [Chitinophagaceae bacterium]